MENTAGEKFEDATREYLEKKRKAWERDLKILNLKVDEWKSEDLLQQAKEAFLHGEAREQAQAAEQIRIQIAYALLQKALKENNRDLVPASGEPRGGQCVLEESIERGKVRMSFFSGTAGERIFISSEGLRLPWVYDGKHYTRKTNMLLRETLKELYPNAQGQDGEDLIVLFLHA